MITQIKPGLVALYDIRPENGMGPFLQPRSPHGALICGSVITVGLVMVRIRVSISVTVRVADCCIQTVGESD